MTTNRLIGPDDAFVAVMAALTAKVALIVFLPWLIVELIAVVVDWFRGSY